MKLKRDVLNVKIMNLSNMILVIVLILVTKILTRGKTILIRCAKNVIIQFHILMLIRQDV